MASMAIQCVSLVAVALASVNPDVDRGLCTVEGCLSVGSSFVQFSTPSLHQERAPPDTLEQEEYAYLHSSLSQVESSASINVVSYNLYWWNVRQNNRWSELWNRIRGESPFDLIGFQECEDVADVVRNSGLSSFDYYQGPKPNPAPLAWNSQVFSKIGGPGNKWIAKDKWGDRHLTWVRLRHKSSGSIVLFANTHGPLGNCGSTVGNNWLAGVNDNKQGGDTVVVTGDFNCGTGSSAMNILKGQLTVAYDGGIDQILSDKGQKANSGNGKRGGHPSDHPLIKGAFTVSGSGGSANPRRRRAQATGGQTWASSTCDPFSQWPNVKNGVTCSSCTALVLTKPYDRCDKYCESFGHTCVGAAEENDNNCAVKYSTTCSKAITGTSDMLCTCQNGGTSSSSSGANPRRRRAHANGGQSSTCTDTNWQCEWWAGNGECSKNPAYMHVNCKRSCNKC